MRERMEAMVRATQDAVCAAFEDLDGSTFRTDDWEREGGGGGWTRVLEGGVVLEKAGVNVSVVYGEMPKEVVAAARGRGVSLPAGNSRFYATGVSLVVHPRNPFCPTVHANYRYFELDGDEGESTWWFGGGTDMTPYYLFEEDARHFHRIQRDACDRHDRAYYPEFKAACDAYFHLPHRGEARGIGGIFFDNRNDRDKEALFSFVSDCAASIVPAILPIYERRKDTAFSEAQREWQRIRRGRYAEFNLVFDRGTLFGLKTGGRTESILMSLPPDVRWVYDHHPRAGSDEAALLEVLKSPRAWI